MPSEPLVSQISLLAAIRIDFGKSQRHDRQIIRPQPSRHQRHHRPRRGRHGASRQHAQRDGDTGLVNNAVV